MTSAKREIRVFVSSTFLDMQGDREILAKVVFPEMRKLCAHRGVLWNDVDMRWGVTDEQKSDERVLPICLEEIRRCRPFFIGLLGERYGWIPDAVPRDVAAREPWLVRQVQDGKSVTEMEMLHGVLNDPSTAEHAFFYFRDPSYGPPVAESDANASKLRNLKDRIRQSGARVRENYANPKALAELVRSDLTAVIDRLYPPAESRDPLAQETADHAAFAASRIPVWVGGSQYFTPLNTFVAESPSGRGLVLQGAPGCGKSALLANWATQHHDDKTRVIAHFVGASARSADWESMLRRLIAELNRGFGLSAEIPDDFELLIGAFESCLLQVSEACSRRVVPASTAVIVLDGVDHLEDRNGAPDLIWLPVTVPEHVRLIVSTNAGRSLDALRKRNWPTLSIAPLDWRDRRTFITEYLAQYAKTLSPAIAEEIASAPQTANPLYLRSLLEELRLYGDHDTLPERISHYLSAQTVEDLFERILERYEDDYEKDRPALVRDSMSLLYASRRGLSEVELRQLLRGPEEELLPQAIWSPLSIASDHALMTRSGYVTFFHGALREAVRRKYLASDNARHAAHLVLANYFERPGDALLEAAEKHALAVRAVQTPHLPMRSAARAVMPSLQRGGPAAVAQAAPSARGHLSFERRMDELLYQLQCGGAWKRLFDLLADLDTLMFASLRNRSEVKACWSAIEQHSPLRAREAYRGVLEAPAEHRPYVVLVALTLDELGHAEARGLWKDAADLFASSGGAEYAAAVSRYISDLGASGDVDGALRECLVAEDLLRRHGDIELVCSALQQRSSLLTDQGRFVEAMDLEREVERLCEAHDLDVRLTFCLSAQAHLLQRQGDYHSALVLFKRVESLRRQRRDLAGVAASLQQQAEVLALLGEDIAAEERQATSERMFAQHGDVSFQQVQLFNHACELHEKNRYTEAIALYEQCESLGRNGGDKTWIVRSMAQRAQALASLDQCDRATSLLDEADAFARRLGIVAERQRVLAARALICGIGGDGEGAMSVHKEEERLARQLNDVTALVGSLGNQALALLILLKRPLEAIVPAEEGWAIVTRHKMVPETAKMRKICELVQRELGNQALVDCEEGRSEIGFAGLKAQERLCRSIDAWDGLTRSLIAQSLTYGLRGQSRDAARAAEEALRLASEKRVKTLVEDAHRMLLASCSLVAKEAATFFERGDYGAALASLEEAERLAVLANSPEHTASARLLRADLLVRCGRPQDSVLALEALLAMPPRQGIEDAKAAAKGYVADLITKFDSAAGLLFEQGKLSEALECTSLKIRLCRLNGTHTLLARGAADRAMLLRAVGRHDEAQAAAAEAHELTAKIGDDELSEALERAFGLRPKRRLRKWLGLH